MNRTIRNLIVAVPLATAALAITPTVAHADEPTPVIVLPPGEGDPQPPIIVNPEPEPVDPQDGPDDKAPVPQPGPQDGPDDKAPVPQPGPQDGPDDKAPVPHPGPQDGPDDKAPAPQDVPEDEPELDQGCFTGCDLPETEVSTPKADVVDVVTPTRVDAGLGSEIAASEQDGSLDLTWLLAGGALVTASGVAFAARQRNRRKAARA